jgi:serine phosphatase RsbU (regulator of sigma subunit)/HAMP domain-containing protein
MAPGRLRAWVGRSLRRKLLVPILVTVTLVLTVLGLLAFLVGRSAVEQEVQQRNRELAALVSQAVGSEFDHRLNTVALLVGQLVSAPAPQARAAALRNFRLQAPTTYRALYLLDVSGTTVIDVSANVEALVALTDTSRLLIPRGALPDYAMDAFERAKSGLIFVSPTIIADSDQVPLTVLGVPVLDSNDLIGAILVVEIDGRNLWRTIDEIRVGDTGRAFVASADGQIIAHPQREYIGRPLPAELSTVTAGYEGLTIYRDPLSGQDLLAAFSPVSGRSGWSIVVEQAQAEALAPVNTIAALTFVVMVLGLGCATIVTFWIARSITRPLQNLVRATDYIARTGDLTHDIPVNGADEVDQLAGSFNGMIDTLRDARDGVLAAQAVAQELRIARQIQTSLLPSGPPRLPGFDIAADSVPANEVGGDFYAYHRLSGGQSSHSGLVINVGDVSGKGIPAALYMAVSASVLAAQVALAADVRQLYTELNTLLLPRSTQTRINTALLTVHLDLRPEGWQAHIVNAGLIAPLHRRGDQCAYLEVGGFPLGSVPGATYRHLDLPLERGDWLVLCSDGIVEAMDPQRGLYGFDRLAAHIGASPAGSASEMVASILKDVAAFTAGVPQHDDMTVVAIRLIQ